MSNLEKYAPLAISAVALVLGLRNKRDISTLTVKSQKNLEVIKEGFNAISSFQDKCWENFDILKTDINQIATSTGFKGTLGVNS